MTERIDAAAQPPSTDRPPADDTLVGRLGRLLRFGSRVAGPLAVATGILVLIGWFAGIAEITILIPGTASMKVNTAIGLTALGLAHALLSRHDGRPGSPAERLGVAGLAVLAGSLGLATIGQNLLGVDIGIDQLFIANRSSGLDAPGRMAPATAAALIALAAVIVSRTLPPRRATGSFEAIAALAAMGLGILALLGYLFAAPELTGAGALLRMAPHTSVLIVVLGLGMLTWLIPDGPLGPFLRDTPGGGLARRTAVVGVVLVPTFGVLRLLGEVAGVYEARFGLVIMVVGSAAIVTAFGFQAGRQLDRVQVARRDAEARYQSLLEAAPDAMVIVRQDGTIDFINAQAERLFGYRRDVLVGQAVERLIPRRFQGEHPDRRRAYVAQPRSRPMGAGLELFALASDGREIPVEISLSPLSTADGLLVSASIRDISERKRSEASQREAEARFHSSFANAPVGQAIVAPDGHLIEVNQAFSDLLGYPVADAIGRTIHDITHRDDRAVDDRLRRQLLEGTGGMVQAEKRYVRRDGHVVWALLSLSLVRDADGRPRYIHEQILDVTARREADEAIARLHRSLEQTNAELQEYASAVSHDLQAPLRRIQIFAERSIDLMGADGPPAARDFVQRIHASASRLQVLVRDLLAYARLGQRTGPTGPVDLGEILADTRDDLSVELEAAGAVVEWTPLPTVQGERSQLGQLFANLLGNAVKFRRPDTPLRVRIESHRSVGPDRTTPVWRIDVTDNGLGFEQAFADRIFQVFERLAPDDIPGTGVGLAICRKVVERHGGWIGAESEPGVGSRFVIELPVMDGSAGQGPLVPGPR